MLEWISIIGLGGLIGFCITMERLIGSLKTTLERQTEIASEMARTVEAISSTEERKRDLLAEQNRLLESVNSGIQILQQKHYEPKHFRYFIVSSSNLDDLQAQVASFLEENWIVLGGIDYDSTNRIYLQCVGQGHSGKTKELLDQLAVPQKL